jgi:two-component system, OmpR family, phosphate regulon response regulator OmpR
MRGLRCAQLLLLQFNNQPRLRWPKSVSHLLLLDDDSRLAEMVISYLAPHGYTFTHVECIADAQTAVTDKGAAYFAGAILDVMLPDGDGFDFLRWLRQRSPLPVLMLTARGDAMDRIVGLELGADDYLPKPFEPRELLARVRAILRRALANPTLQTSPDVLRFGALEIDRGAHRVTRAGEPCNMTGHQFSLLATLAENAGRVMSRDQLMRLVKGEDLEAFDRSIDVHISRIRSLIEEDPKQPKHLLTLRGVGYLFAAQREG